MSEKQIIKIFDNKNIRTIWNDDEEKYYFSIIDVVGVLSNAKTPRKYWNDVKRKLKEEGSQLSANIGQLKMKSSDGKKYLTDVCDTEQLLRLIQSIPSKNAEPFKLWLAEVGNDRINETFDPEIAIKRALDTYKKKGYSDEWINQRLKTIDIRNELTNEWKKRNIKEGKEFAILTNEIYKSWSNMTAKEYKKLKDLKKESLRDNMANTELILNSLAEIATKEISEVKKPDGLSENKEIAKQGGNVAKNARIDLENKIGKSVITSSNNKNNNFLENKNRE